MGSYLEVLIKVFRGKSALKHHDLSPIKQLGHLFRQLIVGLIFGGDPYFPGFFDDLFTDEMLAFIQRGNGVRTSWTLVGLLG